MRLTSFSEYSLRVLMHVASAPAGRTTVSEVARSFDISEHHVVKVVHQLGRAGLLATSRGRSGGLQLARPAEAINVGEVLRAMEGGDVPAECFDPERNRCRLTGRCRLERAFSEAVEAFYAVLDRYTLADIVGNRRVLVAVLHPIAA
jgi:Rrf2 family nitric oxide-sensitive transcriptional repressor